MDDERLNLPGWLSYLIAAAPVLVLMATLAGQTLWERLTHRRESRPHRDSDQETSLPGLPAR